MRKFFIGLAISVIVTASGFHYWQLRWELQTAKFRNDIYESEHRILRDEIAELRAKPGYKNGVIDTLISQNFKLGFNDGMMFALQNSDPSIDYVSIYHKVMESISTNLAVQEKMNKEKLIEAYHKGTTDASNNFPTTFQSVENKDE